MAELEEDTVLQITSDDKPIDRSQRSTIGEWLIICIFVTIAVCIDLGLIRTTPNQQYIPGLDDNTSTNWNFAYPTKESTISSPGLLAVVFGLWYGLGIISIISIYIMDKSFSWKQCRSYCGLFHRMVLFCGSVNAIITRFIKVFTGEPRPYFLQVHDEYSVGSVDRNELYHAYESFPSGHASFSMACLFLLSIMHYNAWKYAQNMHYTRSYMVGMESGNPHAYFLCGLWWFLRHIPLIGIILVFSPTCFAIYVGLTRITDYKHSTSDVSAGYIIGACVAYMTYLLFYNELYVVFKYKLRNHIQSRKRSKVEQHDVTDHNVRIVLQEINT